MLKYGMALLVREITAKSILSKSGIPGISYCVNPYVGCAHACRYCYATFMKRFTGHTEPWGSFVDVKINAPERLRHDIDRSVRGVVMVSSVTDAYQPLEARYRLTRQCIEVLLKRQFPVDILTKSPLVTRDIDLIRRFDEIDVGLTITTDDEKIRKIFEPHAPAINARIRALKTLAEKGIRTYAFIGPVLPMNPESLAEKIRPYASSVLIDRMHYTEKTLRIYRSLSLTEWLRDDFTENIINRLAAGLRGIETIVL